MTDTVITVTGLEFAYPTGEGLALAGIDLAITRGSFVGVTGPSGAGKSTLCQCLKGLIPHSVPGEIAGDVTVLGHNLIDDPPGDVAGRIGMVFQDPEAQIIGLTVAEDLAFGPENFEMDPVEIGRRSGGRLRDVGLEGLIERDTYALSGGQKQRLAIASALMLDPEILILDEPTSELDPIGKSEVFAVVDRLRRDADVTIVMVEHEIERLAVMAGRLLVMDHGRIVADGPPHELLLDVELFRATGGERPPAAAALQAGLRDTGVLEGPPITLDPAAAAARVAERLRA